MTRCHEIASCIDQLTNTSSRNKKEQIVRELSQNPSSISIIDEQTFDDIGIGEKTMYKAASQNFGDFDPDPTLSDALVQFRTDPDDSDYEAIEFDQLQSQILQLEDPTGNEQLHVLEKILERVNHPDLVSHAILDDRATGVSSKTIANALDVRDCLPFYESVTEILSIEDPQPEPTVGEPFAPMLAVSESRGRPPEPTVTHLKIDGYRCLIHVLNGGDEVRAYSRRMNRIDPSLPELEDIDWPDGNWLIDSEVVATDDSYNATSERIGRTRENVDRETDMIFEAFDLLVADGEHIWEDPLDDRMDELFNLALETTDSRYFSMVREWDDISEGLEFAHKNNEEGVIVKSLDAPYQFQDRSKHWQKQKVDDERVDLQIIEFKEGDGEITGTLGKIGLATSGGQFVGWCGSGFSEKQRDEIWENQSKWYGRIVEVEARGLGSNQKLRMPIFKRDRTEDGTVDSMERVEKLMPEV